MNKNSVVNYLFKLFLVNQIFCFSIKPGLAYESAKSPSVRQLVFIRANESRLNDSELDSIQGQFLSHLKSHMNEPSPTALSISEFLLATERRIESESSSLSLAHQLKEAQRSYLNSSPRHMVVMQFQTLTHRAYERDWLLLADREMISFAYLRLAQLEESVEIRKEFIKKSISLEPSYTPDPEIFAPPFQKEFKETKDNLNSRSISFTPKDKWENFRFLILNGHVYDLKESSVIHLTPGFYHVTGLSDQYQPVHALMDATALIGFQPERHPFIDGDCEHPQIDYSLKNIIHDYSENVLSKNKSNISKDINDKFIAIYSTECFIRTSDLKKILPEAEQRPRPRQLSPKSFPAPNLNTQDIHENNENLALELQKELTSSSNQFIRSAPEDSSRLISTTSTDQESSPRQSQPFYKSATFWGILGGLVVASIATTIAIQNNSQSTSPNSGRTQAPPTLPQPTKPAPEPRPTDIDL